MDSIMVPITLSLLVWIAALVSPMFEHEWRRWREGRR